MQDSWSCQVSIVGSFGLPRNSSGSSSLGPFNTFMLAGHEGSSAPIFIAQVNSSSKKVVRTPDTEWNYPPKILELQSLILLHVHEVVNVNDSTSGMHEPL